VYTLKTWWSDTYWWFIHRLVPKHRYHVVDTGLPPGYYDPDIRLLAGIFNEVHKFVANNHWDWTQTEQHRMAWQVLKAADAYGQEYMRLRTECVTFEEETEANNKAVRHAKKVLDNVRSMWY